MSLTTSAVTFSRLFQDTEKSLKKSQVVYYWCILCSRIKCEKILTLSLLKQFACAEMCDENIIATNLV